LFAAQIYQTHVSSGSNPEVELAKADFRFTPVSGPHPASPACPKSANIGSQGMLK